MKTALITGITGQDGAYLSKFLLKKGYKVLGKKIFKTWSCYSNKKFHCGSCESCNNRKAAFVEAGIPDKTKYLR